MKIANLDELNAFSYGYTLTPCEKRRKFYYTFFVCCVASHLVYEEELKGESR